MDSTTSDTDNSCYVGKLIRKQSTAMEWTSSVFAAAEAKAACDTDPADASNPDAAAAAERENDSRNFDENEVTAQTRESPQLYRPPTSSPSRDALTLAQLCHPSHQGLRHNCHDSTFPRWKHPSFLPQSQGNAFEDDTPGMIGTPAAVPSRDTLTLTLAQLHHPRSACSTVSRSILCSEEAEQIWQEIQDHIGNTANDDRSSNVSPPSTESEEVIIPGLLRSVCGLMKTLPIGTEREQRRHITNDVFNVNSMVSSEFNVTSLCSKELIQQVVILDDVRSIAA